jgi:hypothetical protein
VFVLQDGAEEVVGVPEVGAVSLVDPQADTTKQIRENIMVLIMKANREICI